MAVCKRCDEHEENPNPPFSVDFEPFHKALGDSVMGKSAGMLGPILEGATGNTTTGKLVRWFLFDCIVGGGEKFGSPVDGFWRKTLIVGTEVGSCTEGKPISPKKFEMAWAKARLIEIQVRQ